MRFWTGLLAGIAGLGLAAGAELALPHTSGGATILYALWVVLGFSVMAYLWRQPVVSGLVAATMTAGLTTEMGHVHPLASVVTGVFAVLVSVWARWRMDWPLRPGQSLFAILLLVMVSLCLSSLIGLSRGVVGTKTTADLVVLYLSTPPWEWGVVLTALVQAGYLGDFVRSRYLRTRTRDLAVGFLTGLGLIVMTAVVVSIESQGLHMRVVANNPFVTTPGLHQHGLWPVVAIAGAVIVLAPIAEEALFRGILFGSLSEAWGYVPGTLVSATVFGLAHMDITLLLPLALAGLALNALYRSTGSLVASTVAHMTLNAISVMSALGIVR